VRVRVKLFATYREIVGRGELTWSAPDGMTVAGLVDALLAKYPGLAAHRGTMMFAVNRAFAPSDVVLRDGDEVALLPPVSGGWG